MAAATQTGPAVVSLEEYLHTAYHSDRDFVDGVLEERHVGEYEHSGLQAIIDSWFVVRGREWGIRVLTEQRDAHRRDAGADSGCLRDLARGCV